MSRLLLSLCSLALLADSVHAQAKPKITKADLRAILETARKKYAVPALGAVVVTSEGPVTLAVVGVRKRGEKVAVQETDQFHIGSDTKAMTATLIARLVHDKRLTYDRTLVQAFPELKGKVSADIAKVTLRQLLTHRSGLPANLEWEKIPQTEGPMAQRTAVVRKLADVKLEAKPGEKFIYSNLNYVLAAHMAERVMKQSWEELLVSHIAKPLKMKIGYGAMGTKDKLAQPWPHDDKGQPVRPGPDADNPPVMGPAGRVHCSLADWAKFIADQLRGASGKDGLLPASSYKVLHEPVNKGEEYSPGGWLVLSGGRVLAHDGSNTLNYAAAIVLPKRKVAFLIVCNQGGEKGQNATHQARDEILKTLAKPSK